MMAQKEVLTFIYCLVLRRVWPVSAKFRHQDSAQKFSPLSTPLLQQDLKLYCSRKEQDARGKAGAPAQPRNQYHPHMVLVLSIYLIITHLLCKILKNIS